MSTAVSDVDKALYQKVISNINLSNILSGDKFYDSQPPSGTKLPYINLGYTHEGNRGVFTKRGNRGTTRLHIWGKSRKEVLTIYAHLVDITHGASLTLDNNVLVRGELTLNIVMRDPVDANIIHATALYNYITRVQ